MVFGSEDIGSLEKTYDDWSKRVPDDGEMDWTRYDNENV